jgi:hypothetical protein
MAFTDSMTDSVSDSEAVTSGEAGKDFVTEGASVGGDSDHLSKKQRSGSEVRQKQKVVTFRVTAGEYQQLEAEAERTGLTIGSLIRKSVLAAPKTRARRRIPVDVLAVGSLLAQVNKIGGNLYQILKRVNFGDTPLVSEIQEALTEFREVSEAIKAVMRQKA